MAEIYSITTIQVELTPDQLRCIAQAVEDKADCLQVGDSKTAYVVEGNSHVLEFCVDNENHFKKWNLLDYRISVIRDADAFQAALYDGETQLETATGVSVEEAIAKLKVKMP